MSMRSLLGLLASFFWDPPPPKNQLVLGARGWVDGFLKRKPNPLISIEGGADGNSFSVFHTTGKTISRICAFTDPSGVLGLWVDTGTSGERKSGATLYSDCERNISLPELKTALETFCAFNAEIKPDAPFELLQGIRGPHSAQGLGPK